MIDQQPILPTAIELAADQEEARYLLGMLVGTPKKESIHWDLRAALDSGDPYISDIIYEAQFVLGLLCRYCGSGIDYPSDGYCSRNCAEQDGDVDFEPLGEVDYV